MILNNNKSFLLQALVWMTARLITPCAGANSDFMPQVIQPYDQNHRALLEKTPDHICISGKHVHKGKQCRPLLAGHDRDMDTGSVCVELVSTPPQLKVTFESTGDWALVRTKFWAGPSITNIPLIEDTTEVDYDEFDYFYSNYTGYKRWVATAAMTDRCGTDENDMEHFGVSMVAHAEVEQVDAYAHLVPGTQQAAYAYEHAVDGEDEWYGWFDFKVDCKCDQDNEDKTNQEMEEEEEKECPEPHHLVVQTAPERECHTIVAGGGEMSMAAGRVCVKVIDEHVLNGSFVPANGWTLTKNEL